MKWEFGNQNTTFEVPVYGPRRGRGSHVAPDEGAYAVDFSTKAGSVVFVAGETEVCVVETVGFGDAVMVGEGAVDDAANGGLGWVVGGGDLDFLKTDDMGERPAVEAGAEGRVWWVGSGFVGGGRRAGEEGGNGSLCIEVWGDTIDIPGVDA